MYVKTVLLSLHQDLIKQRTLIKSCKVSTLMLFSEKKKTDVEESFEVMLVPEGEIQEVN